MSAYSALARWLIHNHPKVWQEWQDQFKDCKSMKQHDEEHRLE